ncbi:MAG: DUF3791 domain-containing protein [Eggerthellaceae bacterium]|jgi:hypothetical protein|nr:DUF3791 domain-containing protein [Eggerthellaceae bacterium]
MSDQTRYLIYLIEHYALREGITGTEAFTLLEDHGLLPYVHNMYYTYHTERVENAIADIKGRLV